MKDLSKYLEKKQFTKKTINDLKCNLRNYLSWLENNNLTPSEIKYQDILNYIGHLQSRNYKKISINIILKQLEHYYKYKDLDYPALGLRLRGITEIRPNLFSNEELYIIYHTYVPKETGGYRETDKLILGLIIYQALENENLLSLKVSDVDLVKGHINLNAVGRNRKSRIVSVESHQILPFNEYIKQKTIPGILLTENSRNLKNQLQHIKARLKCQLKGINIDLKSLNQLRQSRYAIWYKQHGIRKAQYLGGFKSPYTIQKYANLDIEDLKSAIEKYHPLG